MKSSVPRTIASRTYSGRAIRLPRAVMLTVFLGTLAYGGQVTIFQDDFEDQVPRGNPNPPPVGQPWEISEIVPSGVDVMPNAIGPLGNSLAFGPYRNTALAPFSTADRQRMAAAQNVAISFDFLGYSTAGYLPYLDIAGWDESRNGPAFLIRIAPEQNAVGLHDIYYYNFDPGAGLVDTGLDIAARSWQSIKIWADLANDTLELDVSGNLEPKTLPLFDCPSDLAGVEFLNYGVALGSASIDNLTVTVTELDQTTAATETLETPEPGPLVMFAGAGLVFAVFAWLLWWRAK